MVGVLFAIALAAPAQTDEPAAVVRHALAAIEGDSVTRVRDRWSRQLARDSSDRIARLGLGVFAQLTYQDTVADRFYGPLLPAAGGRDAAAGYAAIYLSRLSTQRGQWLRADSLGVAAVAVGRALRDSALTGEALVALSVARHRTAGFAAAAPLVDSAQSITPAREFRILALAHCARAQMLYFGGNPNALIEARRGVELADQSGDFRTRGVCRSALASEFSREGQIDSALIVYQQVIGDYRRAREHAGLAGALQWRSHMFRLVGWMAASVRDANEAIAEAEIAHVPGVIPWARTTLAFVALQMGDVAGAAPHAAEATRRFNASGDRYAATTAYGLQANIASATGDLDAARAALAQALERANALNWAESKITVHRALMHLAMREGDLATARRELDLAGAVARAGHMEGFASNNEYHDGVLALLEGRLDVAERIFRARLARSQRAQPQWAYLDAERLAEVLIRRGRSAQALDIMQSASKNVDDWRHDLRDRQLRLFALQLTEDSHDPDLGVATIIDGLAHGGKDYAAFDLIEAIRGREIADRLTRAVTLDTTQGDRVVRADRPWSLAAMLRDMPDSTALVRYVTGRGNEPTTVFVVTFGEFTTHRLPAEDSLAAAVMRFSALLESGDDAKTLGRELGRALLDSVVSSLRPGITRLVIVPDGVLARVPFDALILDDDHFALERFSVSYAPSATAAMALWRRESPAGRALLVFADPRFAHESKQQDAGADVFRGAVAGRSGLPRLPGSAREASAITRYSDDATVRRRDAASEAWLKQSRLDGFSIVHFATHALVDEGSITNTALALTPGDNEDGFVNAGEIMNLKLSADLVVLSACRTAGGMLVRGEGVQGLANPLLAAGARAVAATWWPIGDAATVRTVEDFYGGLGRGLNSGDALHEAKLAALRRGAPVREWAAFAIIGDATRHAPLHPPAPRSRAVWIWIAAAAAVLAVLLYGAMRRRRTVDAG